MQESDISNFFGSPIRLVAASSAVGLGVLAFVAQPILAKQMNEWRLLPRPERVTQLYFTDYDRLSVSANHSPDRTVTFTVRNFEHRTTGYRYTITAAPEDGKNNYSLGNGSFSLRHAASLTTKKTVTLPLLNQPLILKINLEYEGIAFGAVAPSIQTQSIHYWVAAAQLPSEDGGDYEGA